MAEEQQTEQTQPQGFDLNTWKAQYQNNKNRLPVAFEWLWQNYDPENWYEDAPRTRPPSRDLTC